MKSPYRLFIFFTLLELAASADAVVLNFAGHRAFSVLPINTVAASFLIVHHAAHP